MYWVWKSTLSNVVDFIKEFRNYFVPSSGEKKETEKTLGNGTTNLCNDLQKELSALK